MSSDQTPMSVGQYVLMLILTGIPLIGIILLFVWAFGGNVNANKQNYARAVLILSAVGVIFAAIFSSALVAIFSAVSNSL